MGGNPSLPSCWMLPVGPLVTCVSGASPGDQNWSCGQKRGQATVLPVENPTHNLFCSSDVQSQHITVFVPGVCVELPSWGGGWGYFAWLGRALICPDGQWVLVWAG